MNKQTNKQSQLKQDQLKDFVANGKRGNIGDDELFWNLCWM